LRGASKRESRGLTDHLHRAALIFSIQSWLGESEESRKNSSTPGYFSVGMACKQPQQLPFLLGVMWTNVLLTQFFAQSCH